MGAGPTGGGRLDTCCIATPLPSPLAMCGGGGGAEGGNWNMDEAPDGPAGWLPVA